MPEYMTKTDKTVVKRWEENLLCAKTFVETGDLRDIGNYESGRCGYCEKYNTRKARELGLSCQNCPIQQNTGQTLCHGTPHKIIDTLDDMMVDIETLADNEEAESKIPIELRILYLTATEQFLNMIKRIINEKSAITNK